MASDENDKQQIQTTVIVVAVIAAVLVLFGILYAFRGQVSGQNQVGLGYANIEAQRTVGVAESQRYANNPNLTTIMGDVARPIPVFSTM